MPPFSLKHTGETPVPLFRPTNAHKGCEPNDSPSNQPDLIPFFDKAHPAIERAKEPAHQRPIAVQAGQINQRRQRCLAVDAELKLLFHWFHLGIANSLPRIDKYFTGIDSIHVAFANHLLERAIRCHPSVAAEVTRLESI
jgi:hypothetical protein